MLPFDLHVLSIPPAFNLSQDQTLQFKFDSCLWQPIFLTRNSIELTLESLVDLWPHQSQRSTHTNYLSDLLKSFRNFLPGKDRLFYRPLIWCQELFPESRSAPQRSRLEARILQS